MNHWTLSLIHALQGLPSEWVGVLIYITAIATLAFSHWAFGKEGLFLFMILAVIIGNIQALKAISLSFFEHPVAMGSILFTMTLLATDILSEYYGKKAAEKAIWLGFAGLLILCVFMLLTLGASPLSALPTSPLYRYVETHHAMELLFSPSPALLLASLMAYIISQYADMHLFLWLKKQSNGRFLSIRTFLATFFATLIDNGVFSILAWKVFYPIPIDFHTFLFTYILGTFGLRMVIIILNTPLIYFIRLQNRKRSILSAG